MEITRQKSKTNDNIFEYVITEDGKQLKLTVNKAGDLYWLMDDTEADDYASFTITRENEQIYSLFARLYTEIMDNKAEPVQNGVEYTEEDKQAFNNSMAYYFLTRDGNITWFSDKDAVDECDIMTITPQDDCFQLEFVHQVTDLPLYYKPGMFDIAFKKEGSRYTPFNKVFMNMFLRLQNYDPEYHQVHIEELAYEEKKLKR